MLSFGYMASLLLVENKCKFMRFYGIKINFTNSSFPPKNSVIFARIEAFQVLKNIIFKQKMKKTTLALASAAFLLTGCTQSGVNLNLEGYAPDDSVIVYVNSFSGNDAETIIDTLAAPNGKLFISVAYDKAKTVVVFKYPKMNPDSAHQSFQMKPVYAPLIPGANITIEGTADEFSVKGNSSFYRECNKVELRLKPYKDSVASLLAQMEALDPEFEAEQRKMLYAQIMQYKQPVDSVIFEYVKDNPNLDAALYMLHKNTRSVDAGVYLSEFTQEVREGAFSELYGRMVKQKEKMDGKKAPRQVDGRNTRLAPDFALTNDAGERIALSSLRGKYVVLDFWGTWCGWCIKGIPEMKKMYSKYSSRLEVVGIACGDKEDVWKKSIKEYGLEWTNLIMLDGDVNVPELYSVKGFPTKVVIDPQGNIVKTVIGESSEFYTLIDGIMKE